MMFQDAMAIAAASVDAKSNMKPAIMGATMRHVKSIVLQEKINKILIEQGDFSRQES